MGANNTTSAFAKTGLYPLNPLSDSMETAIATPGINKALDLSRNATTQWEVKKITTEEGRPDVSEEKEISLLRGWNFQESATNISTPEESNSNLVIAKI